MRYWSCPDLCHLPRVKENGVRERHKWQAGEGIRQAEAQGWKNMDFNCAPVSPLLQEPKTLPGKDLCSSLLLQNTP